MDLGRRLHELSNRLGSQLEHITTEEATKNALVLPFIQALGYNIFDPTEVTPELTADVGIKRGEKVDYAIMRDGKPILLFECKMAGTDLDRAHVSQLYRYFSVTEARFAVLTNGIEYRFFTDLDARNRMDSKPFLEVNLSDPSGANLDEVEKFHAEVFDEDNILETASDLKYTRELKRLLTAEHSSPSEDLVKFFASQVYEGRLTRSVREQFKSLTRTALQEYISERVSGRLQTALKKEAEASAEALEGERPELKVETTEEELQGYYTVKAIVSKVVDSTRITMRDQQSYCSVLVDNNNRKPICRLWFNTSQKYLGTFDEQKDETRNPIDNIDGIYAFAEQLRDTALLYGRDQTKDEVE